MDQEDQDFFFVWSYFPVDPKYVCFILLYFFDAHAEFVGLVTMLQKNCVEFIHVLCKYVPSPFFCNSNFQARNGMVKHLYKQKIARGHITYKQKTLRPMNQVGGILSPDLLVIALPQLFWMTRIPHMTLSPLAIGNRVSRVSPKGPTCISIVWRVKIVAWGKCNKFQIWAFRQPGFRFLKARSLNHSPHIGTGFCGPIKPHVNWAPVGSHHFSFHLLVLASTLLTHH